MTVKAIKASDCFKSLQCYEGLQALLNEDVERKAKDIMRGTFLDLDEDVAPLGGVVVEKVPEDTIRLYLCSALLRINDGGGQGIGGDNLAIVQVFEELVMDMIAFETRREGRTGVVGLGKKGNDIVVFKPSAKIEKVIREENDCEEIRSKISMLAQLIERLER